MLPRRTEADVSKTDGTPGKKCCKTRERKEPVKDGGALGSQTDISKKTKGKNSNSREKRTSRSIDVGKDLWCVTLLCQSCKSSGSSIHSTVADRHDGYQNNEVHEAVIADEASIFGSEDERRGGDVDERVGTQKTFVC